MIATRCLLCGSSESHPVFRNRRDKYFQKFDHLRDRKSVLVMCASCGFAYHNPKLDESETEQIYRLLYRPEAPSEEFFVEKRKAMLSHLEFIGEHLDLSRGGAAARRARSSPPSGTATAGMCTGWSRRRRSAAMRGRRGDSG